MYVCVSKLAHTLVFLHSTKFSGENYKTRVRLRVLPLARCGLKIELCTHRSRIIKRSEEGDAHNILPAVPNSSLTTSKLIYIFLIKHEMSSSFFWSIRKGREKSYPIYTLYSNIYNRIIIY